MKRHPLSPDNKYCFAKAASTHQDKNSIESCPAKAASTHDDKVFIESDHGCSNHDSPFNVSPDNDAFLHPSHSKNSPSVPSFPGLRKDSVYKYDPSIDKRGYFNRRLSYNIPIPPDFQLPPRSEIGINILKLELMLFIIKHFLPPTRFDAIMAWEKKARQDAGYKCNSPKHSTLKQRLDISIPPTLHGGLVITKVFSTEELEVDEPVTLFYFDLIKLLKVKFPNPFMKNFVCYPQLKRTN